MARRENRTHDGRKHDGPSQRQLRVGEELRHALAHALGRQELRDPALQNVTVTVTEVRVSPDLKNATAYVMPLGGAHAPEILAGLRRSAPFLRGVVGRAVPLRHVPSLGFELDTSFEHASRIEALLHRPDVARDLAGDDDQEE
jgi:ribosome-binding factor A